jgi:Flp pilus assembly protein TadG
MTTITRFRDDCRGATAVLFGVLLLPIMLSAGAALDYLRASKVRTAMQVAVDAAALAAARDAPGLTDAQVTERARSIFAADFHEPTATVGALTVQKNDKTVRVAASGSVATTIMGIVHVDTIEIGASAQVAWGRQKIELALVLDNTGSMAEAGKMPALKTAVRDFLNVLENYAYDRDAVKIAIVPFDTQVNVGTGFAGASWLTFDADLPRELRTDRAHWRGCVSDRSMPYDTQDGGQSSADARYPAARCSDSSLQELRPLTNDFGPLRRTVEGMQPSGLTNITIGVMWGLDALTPGGALGGGVAMGTPGVEKIMVVLTDGDNTRNRFTGRVGDIDARTRLACKTAKDAAIKVHTIRVIEGNANLLRECASEPGNYHEVSRASDLDAVFRQIASDITKLRLTH